MEPIPETRQALEDLGSVVYDGDLLHDLQVKAAEAREIVPDCVGVSVGSTADGITFTLVSSTVEAATSDAVQYLETGPCVEALRVETPLGFQQGDPLGEVEWELFARATAAVGIESTLTLPVVEDDQVVGTVNLYASSPGAFDGHHEQLARLFDAWAPGAITNADLSFETRRTAAQAASRLRDAYRLEVAVGILSARHDVGMDAARELLEDVARRAGVSAEELAALLVESLGRHDAE